MATRRFCDHCGTQTEHLVIYQFGPRFATTPLLQQFNYTPNNYTPNNYTPNNYIPGTTVFPGIVTIPTSPPPLSNLKFIDLCPRCEQIWMNRVEKLTTHEG